MSPTVNAWPSGVACDRVREVESDGTSCFATQVADRGHIEHLPGVVLHAGQQQQGYAAVLPLKNIREIVDV